MSNWNKETRIDLLIKLVLLPILPFFASVYSLLRINTRSSYLIIFISSLLFALSFTSDNNLSEGFDAYHYRNEFYTHSYMSLYEFKLSFIDYIEGLDPNKKDFYFDTLSFLTSRVTDNYHVLFVVIAIPFSYFALKSLRFLTSQKSYKFGLISLILTYLFTINQIFNINGARFWTTAWVAVYCLLQIYVSKNRRYYLLVLFLPIMHGSFFLFLILILIADLTKNRHTLWKALFFLSAVIAGFSSLLIQYSSTVLDAYLPSVVKTYIDNYTSVENLERAELISFLPNFFNNLIKMYIFIVIYLFIKNSKIIMANPRTRDLYLFLLVLATFSFSFSTIPSLGGRYLNLAYPLIAYIWLETFKNDKYKIVIYALPFIFSLQIYLQFFNYIAVFEPINLLLSPFYLIYKYIII